MLYFLDGYKKVENSGFYKPGSFYLRDSLQK